MDIKFAGNPTNKGVVALFVEKGNKLTAAAKEMDSKLSGLITRALENSKFKGEVRQTLMIPAPESCQHSHILLLGIGDAKKVAEKDFNAIGGTCYVATSKLPISNVDILANDIESKDVVSVAMGGLLRSWSFDKYHTKKKEEDKPTIKTLTLVTSKHADCQSAFGHSEAVADGVFLTRELGSEPANILYPESFAEKVKELSKLGIKVEVLGEAEMKKLGMGALLGVGQGSVRESQLAVMQWNGGPKDEKPVAFVGKGVTFDTGGISIKPAANMEEMKTDMSGAAAVTGLMKSLATRKAKVNAVGVIGIVENMPSGSAQRPGDVVTTMSGQTIEVLNTDAEGRLVLADALWYTQDRFKPKFIVDLATLTGAIIVSLAHEYAGIFADNEELAKRLIECGGEVNEKLWRMPLDDAYDKDINSDIADMKNLGTKGAGSCTAAHLLKRHTNNVPWAHLDIAGTAWSKCDMDTCAKGSTGFGVRLLDRLVSKYYEQK